MDKFVKRIQSRIISKGISPTPSLETIRGKYQVHVANPENPTEEEINKIVNIFVSARSNISLRPETELEPSTSLTPSSENSGGSLIPPSPQVRNMVQFQAQQMGIQIASSQVDVIAASIDETSKSFAETLAAIEAALHAYIDFSGSREVEQVTGMLNRVTQKVVDKNATTTQTLEQGINSFKSALEVAETEQKRQLASVLSRLAINRPKAE